MLQRLCAAVGAGTEDLGSDRNVEQAELDKIRGLRVQLMKMNLAYTPALQTLASAALALIVVSVWATLAAQCCEGRNKCANRLSFSQFGTESCFK